MFALREANIDDAPEIARLAGELGYPAGADVMRARLQAVSLLPRQRIVVAQGDGLLGWVALERRYTLESGEFVEIVGLVVDASTRGKGVGRALVADAEEWACAQGFGSIGVRSNVAREGSHPFYERLGYSRIKTQHMYRKALK
ncbi:GNAT family N-acetyltransferase [Rhodanobacter sp. DHG33]|uniref:GNAT family N-acetyltransferase n=1 Tax=Rhodanobacter sp. DHG33 TaxID=2775921 RepID=UPI00178384A6|nr:GNAT family N-acetyltransferase [Rhodanobacter sp. DHG33]MBD8900390.1 GNAT family N-acetyltransferase [Rhodanobacter sp. DHG33]